MISERWKRVEEIFQAALDRSPDERQQFIAEACAGDEKLRAEIEALVEQYEAAGDFIETPPIAIENIRSSGSWNKETVLLDHDRDAMAGARIGAYRIVREIGRGGMGAVYLAERDDGQFRKQVAIKLIKRGMDTDFILRRFRNERQILASLDHPNIGRLLDGGTTPDGLPYFVMEYIEGQPLYVYCDNHQLTIRERLRLFCQICGAVYYAHQNLVIHRDIKPGNILVAADGTPKLLDFGIAKLLNPDLAAQTLDPTLTALRLMTPEYASPEQMMGEAVTTSTDVYSLGVLLYELLTGQRPYRLRYRSPYEQARVICEEEPIRPSVRITQIDEVLLINTSGEEQSAIETICAARSDTLENLRRELSGNLDNIVLKTLRKTVHERYASVEHLCADITRHLEGRPVSIPFHYPATAATTTMLHVAPSEAESPNGGKSIAVLPFKMFGSVTADDTGSENYLGAGLADALITRLSQINRLSVRPTSSIMRYTDAQSDPLTAGRELGVPFVLDGRIRRAGEQIRVTTQLLDVRNGATVWGEQFDEKFTDVLALEDRISAHVAEALVPHLTGDERLRLAKRNTNNAEAYEAYLRGRYHWNQFTPDSLPKSLAAFQKAVELDPNYALAYVGLADFYIWANIYGLIPSSEAVPLAEAAARRAIELDDQLGEAYATLSLTNQNRRNWAECERLYKRALELAPNYVHVHEWNSAYLVGSGRFEEGVEESKHAERLDPLSLRTKTLTAWTLYQAHRFDEALERGTQIIELDKNYPQGYSQIGLSLLALGYAEDALANFRKFDSMIPPSALAKYQLCFALVALNRHDEARAILEEIKRLAAESYVKPYFLGMAHTALGERDEAFRCFEQSFAEYDPWLLWFGTEPMLDALRDDPRYEDLLRRMTHPLAKHQTITAEQPDQNREKSIAVLPLNFIGAGEPDDAYLAVGLADAMITRLSNVQRLVLRPTSSVLRYADCTDSFLAGKELGVDFVLCGTVRRAGGRLRISAQLLDVQANSTRWAEKFDENFTDILELEDLVAEKVARMLVPQLTGEEEQKLAKRGTDSAEAFEAYIRGRYQWSRFTEEGFAKALTCYYQAIALDPNYAAAYTGIADYYNWLGVYGVLPPAECFAAAKDAATKAVELDATLAEAHTALGFAVLCLEHDWAAGEAHHLRAIELNPNYATAHQWYSFHLSTEGHFDEAITEMRRALELDPLSPSILQSLGWSYYQARRFDESLDTHRRLTEEEPRFGLGRFSYALVLHRVGRREEAIEEAKRAVELSGACPFVLALLGTIYAGAGRDEEARAILRDLNEVATKRYVSPYHLAPLYLNLGDREEAFNQLERAFAMRDAWVVWLGVEPGLDALRSDPRFADLLRRTKNPMVGRADPMGDGKDEKESEEAEQIKIANLLMGAALMSVGDEKTIDSKAAGRTSSAIANPATLNFKQYLTPRAVLGAALLIAVALSAIFIYVRNSRQLLTSGSSNGLLRLTYHLANDSHPDFSPDGSKVVFASNRDGRTEIYVMNRDGSDIRRLTFNTADDDCPEWSPDGRRIAFQSKRDGQMEIYVMEADGSNQINLTNDPAEDLRPSWSPDGASLAYTRNRLDAPADFDIYTMRADGSSKTRLTDAPAMDVDPAWSPDGTRIAFSSEREGNYEIYVMKPDGTEVRNLTNHPGNEVKPAWSPDNRRIAFAANRPTKNSLTAVYVMNSDGSDQRLFTGASTYDDEPAWSPDGGYISFQSQRDGNAEVYTADANTGALTAPATNRSIAVLPLSNVDVHGGGDDERQYLGVGLADSLSNKLSQMGGLTISTPAAVRRYLNSTKTALEAGRELGVNYVLTGTIEHARERVRVALELTDVAAGRVVWAETFDEPHSDLLSLQTSASERIARALRLELTNDERERLARRSTEDNEAYQLYLAGRYHWGKRTAEGLRQAITNFERAIARDDRFALAYTGLADCYALLNWYVEPPPADAWTRAREAATRAVELDDTLAEAHVSLAFVKFHFERDWTGAEEQFRRAINLKPNYATAHHWYAFNLSAMERHEDAITAARRAQELDPRSAVVTTALANVLYHARRFDEAISQCERALELDPGSVSAHVVMRWSFEKKGMFERAFQIYERERAFAGDTPTTRAKHAHILAESGRTDEARRVLNELLAARSARAQVTPYEIAVIYALLDDRDRAFQWLAQAEREHVVGFTFVRVDPHLDNLRSDPRYTELLRMTRIVRN
jgi:eukaryotic-like serine/threonine-protein kinase